jgi:hypothetical protein
MPSNALSASSKIIFLARMPSTRKFALRALFHVPKKSTKTIE